ncbi:phosphatidylinositol-3-phosphatase SAC1-like isoform X2 [Mytilus californianus]|nr:phosphatidylinositol-3-phosphatase SAC1-like isoform X2 [Mytilus californianus]XP_052060416.1 phosphatidylinositol-3-phosphatase SAC1-like isoform X2 [Mytilus californianus]XP_052060417.1 phosphatidylinositol-3-phosphatase SAC1-like isoform X2 [Mytilus californianus]XP_052060418.1 phosphatidylinositol-3-phosphatase SAC1-like isoform X2 [Mytilus californianus]XP_052060419.1 phosphatidylinositol-3-phosphatase SAC1-like isoform X2 [Mytilus californianus]
MLSYKRTTLHLTEKQTTDNKTYVNLVEHCLKTESYYFSTTYDLTHSLQRLSNTSSDFVSMPLHERADSRFTWNGHILKELTQQPELHRFCLPVLHGFICITPSLINNKSFDHILISRRCVLRVGTRFWVRGIDTEGQVANFVETEQILEYEKVRCSYVQTRGSIPIFWSQRPNLKYKPKIKINAANYPEVFQRHFDNQVYNYGEQVIVNLVNQAGSEGLLEKSFSQFITNSQNKKMRYEYFDFHHECGNTGLRWDRLSILMERLEDDIRRQNYFMMQKDGTVLSQQVGIFRTNCIDCLDRTNVVQSLIAKVVLQNQLTKLGILDQGQQIKDCKTFNYTYNNDWADNADVMSKQYAGTGALKTDITRQGKRTKYGLLMDGWNSLIRYFKNNFSDGFRQDSMDLFLGNYIVEENEGVVRPSPLQSERDWKFYAIPVIFVIATAMCLICILIPDENISTQLMYILFWGTASFLSLAAIYIFGSEFVDTPKLVHSKDLSTSNFYDAVKTTKTS